MTNNASKKRSSNRKIRQQNAVFMLQTIATAALIAKRAINRPTSDQLEKSLQSDDDDE